MNPSFPRRGDLYWTQLGPAPGAAMQKTRPCVVITKDMINQHRRTVVVVPLSNTSPRNFPLHVALPSAGETSQAVVDQIRAVDKGSIGKRIGSVTVAEMEKMEEAIRMVLGLE